ncbi:MAG: hypothetical protein JRI95_05575 [Deltaproteobacteria bacterium]|nr:hypothetical protein [Deltaproteobacteria bacterium]
MALDKKMAEVTTLALTSIMGDQSAEDIFNRQNLGALAGKKILHAPFEAEHWHSPLISYLFPPSQSHALYTIRPSGDP